jgi:transposase
MPGKHITDDRLSKYRSAHKKWNRQTAARMASISVNSARRIDRGIHVSQRPAMDLRTARRGSKLSTRWSEVASTYIASHPGVIAKDVFDYLLDFTRDTRCPVKPSHRRSFERWYVREKLGRGINPKTYPDLIESYAFLRSAHQDSFDKAKLINRKYTIAEMTLILDTAMSSSLRRRNCAVFVLGNAFGIPHAHIASYLMLSQSTIMRWTKELISGSLQQFLSPLSRKRPKRESQNIKAVLFKTLHTPPTSYDFSRTNWRAIDLKSAMQKEGVITSLWTIRNMIRSEGYHWRKAKISLTSTDQRYKEKVDRIKSILSKLQSDEAFFSVDEFGPFTIRLVSGRQLVGPGVLPIVPQWQKSRGHLILTAALELGTNQITHFYSEKKNTMEMIKIIDLVRCRAATKRVIYFSWDAASWHMSKALNKHVESINELSECDGLPNIVLVPLPARAQFLNVIESVFSGMARAVIHNSNFDGVTEAKKILDGYIEQRNSYFLLHPRRAGNKIWGCEKLASAFNESQNFKDPRY